MSQTPVGSPNWRWALRKKVRAIIKPVGHLIMLNHGIYSLLEHLPIIGYLARSKVMPPSIAWQLDSFPELPASLRTQPGIKRDIAVETESLTNEPLQDMRIIHTEAMRFTYLHSWYYRVKAAPRLLKASHAIERQQTDLSEFSPHPVKTDSDDLTAMTRQRAAEFGLSTIGIANYDAKYNLEPVDSEIVGDRIIVCVLEQDWRATQSIPSERSGLAQLVTYAVLQERALKLAESLKQFGYKAKVYPPDSKVLILKYAVESGGLLN